MSSTAKKIVTIYEARETIEHWQSKGDKVVFTNGCFDIMHLGHIDYLEKARTMGDKMIVALNTDMSVSRLKGPKRPVINEYARSRMMAAFSFVDLVILFDEETPLEIITLLKPDILVKGNDYCIKDIVGHKEVQAHGGSVKTVELVEGYSTTNIINKIKKL